MSKTTKHPNHRIFEERKRMYLEDFANEAPQIRDSIVKDLPAYNTLLSLKAHSFEDFALQYFADTKGMSYDASNPPLPDCPYCETNAKVGKKGKDLYRCSSCSHSFSANFKSISSGTKCDALTWMKVLICLLNYTGMTKTCEYCDITNTTYYKIRNRLFYAMQVLLEDLKLYGNIQVDNTFVRSSYKGANLKESEFDEESIFFDPTFKPRAARQRGGSYSSQELNRNNICIFTAIDDYGHVLTRYAGIGVTNFRSLLCHIPADKYLLVVPKTDPFKDLLKNQNRKPITGSGDQTMIVSDKEKAIEKYARHIGTQFESHVYRRNGKQVALSENAHNIQRVNALHRRLKDFLQKHHYISTKYLPGYLILFEFIENTGASTKAINQLFKILAKPNFDKPSSFFEEMYSVPNYLVEWLVGENPLSKIPFNKLYSFFLFDQFRHKEEYPGTKITIAEIEDETGYTAPTIRKNYRELVNAGYRDLILTYFNKLYANKPKQAHKQKSMELSQLAPATINPIVLAIFDEHALHRNLPPSQRPSFKDFIAEKNKQYGTNFTRQNIYAKFRYIEEHGIRPPLKELTKAGLQSEGRTVNQKTLNILDDYQNIIANYQEQGKILPNRWDIYRQLGNKYSLSPDTIKSCIKAGKDYKTKQGSKT